jgi:hypothetical protein
MRSATPPPLRTRLADGATAEHQELGAAGAGLHMLGHGEGFDERQGSYEVVLEAENDQLAGPAWRIFHDDLALMRIEA